MSTFSKRFSRFFLIAFLGFFLAACSSDEPTFKESDGTSLKFSALKGKWVVLNYWAKWCASCLKEIPQLNAFSQNYAKTVAVIGVSFDDLSAEQLKQLSTQLNIQYPLLVDKPNDYLHIGVISVVPTTIILNPAGHVAKTLLGPQTQESLQQAIGIE